MLADVIGHHNISHPRALIDLAHRLVDKTGSNYAVSRLTDYLKSFGRRVRRSSVVDWLVAFENAGLLFKVNIFASSPTRISVSPRKVQCIDRALAVSASSGILPNRYSLLQDLVFTALRRVTLKIFYFKTKTGREVDLVALLPTAPGDERTILLVQVCASLADPAPSRARCAPSRKPGSSWRWLRESSSPGAAMKPPPWDSAPLRSRRPGGFCWRWRREL